MILSGAKVGGVLGVLAVGAGIYGIFKVVQGARVITDGLGITDVDVGPPLLLVQGARGREAAMIRAGYLERLPDGSTRITDAGELYIEQQQLITGSGFIDGPSTP